MRKALRASSVSGLEWLAATCFAATILVWAVIDLSTETHLQWITETAFLPVVGLLIPLAGLITGSITSLRERGSIKPASLMGASSPLVATIGFFIGLAIAMGRFEAVVYTGP
jgi:hypothetical protein